MTSAHLQPAGGNYNNNSPSRFSLSRLIQTQTLLKQEGTARIKRKFIPREALLSRDLKVSRRGARVVEWGTLLMC